MNIVIISSSLPYPLNSGGAQAQYNIINNLRKKHSFFFVFPENGSNRLQNMEKMQQLWPEVKFFPYRYIKQLCNPTFLVQKAKRFFDLKMCPESRRFKVERVLKPYGYVIDSNFCRFVNRIIGDCDADIVQVDFYPYMQMIDYLPDTVKKVFIHHEIRFVRNQRLLNTIALKHREKQLFEKIRDFEIQHLNRYDCVVTLTDTDKSVLTDAGVTVPICVSPAAVCSESNDYEKWNGNITFLGGYSHKPNQEGMDWFLKEVVLFVDMKQFPTASVNIVGTNWPNKYETVIGGLCVKRKGFVEKLTDAICGSIMIVPILSGSGMRMKILEAAALGVPFITTTIGVEGLRFVDGESCLVADCPKAFAKALNEMMSNEDLRRKLTHNAKVVFENNYSVNALSDIREKIYSKIN